MMKRIDKWYQKWLETYEPVNFIFSDDLDKIQPTSEIQAQPKKRGRKAKA